MKMPRLRYEDLTAMQKHLVCNGCGGKGSKIPVPEFRFHASCNKHDFSYWVGGSEKDRKRADKGFYRAMKKDAGWDPGLQVWAWTYYRAVRLMGNAYFHYTEFPRTFEDLETATAWHGAAAYLSRGEVMATC